MLLLIQSGGKVNSYLMFPFLMQTIANRTIMITATTNIMAIRMPVIELPRDKNVIAALTALYSLM